MVVRDVETTSVSRAAISEPIAVRAITQAVAVLLPSCVGPEFISLLSLPDRSGGGNRPSVNLDTSGAGNPSLRAEDLVRVHPWHIEEEVSMGAMHVMSKLRFNISMSLDGYVAGPNQSSDDPLGEGGEQLHDWVVRTRAFKSMRADSEDGETGLDNDRAEHWRQDFGAA